MIREQAIAEVRKAFQREFPKVRVNISFDKDFEETFIAIDDERLYNSEDFKKFAAQLETDLLWPHGFFNIFFVTSIDSPSSSVEESESLDQVTSTQQGDSVEQASQRITSLERQLSALYKEVVALRSRTVFLENRLAQIQTQQSTQLGNWLIDLYAGSGGFTPSAYVGSGYVHTEPRYLQFAIEQQESGSSEEKNEILPQAVGQG